MTKMMMTRRALLTGVSATVLSFPAARPLMARNWPVIEVQKSPSCGCCTAWIDLAREAGFELRVTEALDYVGMKTEAGVPEDLWSCHTARVDGYVIEGHVPFAAIERLLEERPDIAGIAVPGMPEDSPGMGGDRDAVVPVTAWGGSAGASAPFAL